MTKMPRARECAVAQLSSETSEDMQTFIDNIDAPPDHVDAGGEVERQFIEELAAPVGRGATARTVDCAELLRRIIYQDEAALAELYDALAGHVYAVAVGVTRRRTIAEEVVEDTFWQVWRQAPRYDPQRGSAVGWVLMMAHSRSIDALRAVARARLETDSAAMIEQIADVAAAPHDVTASRELGRRLQEALAALDPLRRQLVSLAYFRGLTQGEIAKHTGLPLGTVKSSIRRALATLRLALGADWHPGGAP